jgi:PAS domain S-box-containing protein
MDTAPIRILLIDDDEDDYVITQDMLSDLTPQSGSVDAEQYRLEWVDNYPVALKIISQGRHDIYLVDFRLGEYDGLQLIREAVRRGCNAPLILLTGQGDRAIDLMAMKAGAADYLVKGNMDAYLLERSIRYALGRWRAADEIRKRNRELALFNHIIAASAHGAEPDTVIETACRETAIVLGLPLASALLFNDKKTYARIITDYFAGDLLPTPRLELPVKDTPIFRELLTNKAPLIINGAYRSKRLHGVRHLLRWRKLHSLLVLPMIINDEVVGALVFGNTRPYTYSTEEINLSWSIADYASGALARARLTRSHKRLITAIEQSDECVIIIDLEGIVEYVNPAFELVTGYSPSEAIGQSLDPFSNADYEDTVHREILATLHQGRVWHGQFTSYRKDGTSYTEEATISPVRNEQQEISNYVYLKRDVTHQRQLEEQLRQSQKMDAIGQLAGGVAHDFNNLLTAIMSYAGLALEMIPENHVVKEDLEGIQRTAERAAALTRQLLAFARRQVAQPRVIDLNELIVGMNKLLRRLIGADIELITLPGQSLGKVYMDPGQFEQVLVNLVVNARDAMPDGGKLSIETTNTCLDESYTQHHAGVSPGKYVVLSVSDTGMGMTKEVMDHIFEPFFTTKEVGKGTGLGLATCFGIVAQSRGHIGVYSEPGVGTTLKVYLPYVGAWDNGNLTPDAQVVLPGGTETVLIVEDETTVRDLAARVLRQRGYRILEATNGEEALRIIDDTPGQHPDLIVTDIVMPRMGGKELVLHLNKRNITARVLFISGYTDNAVVTGDLLESGSDFLQKPFTPEQLAHKVRQVLNSHQPYKL